MSTTTPAPKITKAIAQKVVDVVNCGLSHGLGKPEPGRMCVEAAVCYALGEPHSDCPKCVDPFLRKFKIELNDQEGWADELSRARGLRALAVAQLGTRTGFAWPEFVGRLKFRLCRHELVARVQASDPRNAPLAALLAKARTHREVEDLLADWGDYTPTLADVRADWLDIHPSEDIGPLLEYLDLGHAEPALRKVADAATAVLVEMKTPGSRYLYLLKGTKVRAPKAEAGATAG